MTDPLEKGLPMTVIIHGPQGCGKTTHAKALAAHFGCSYIVDNWNGEWPVPEGALVLSNINSLQDRPGVMDFDTAMRAAGLRPLLD